MFSGNVSANIGGEPVLSLTISADWGNTFWSFQAELLDAASYYNLVIAPGAPPNVTANICGHSFSVKVESGRENYRRGTASYSLTGRSRLCELAAPYANRITKTWPEPPCDPSDTVNTAIIIGEVSSYRISLSRAVDLKSYTATDKTPLEICADLAGKCGQQIICDAGGQGVGYNIEHTGVMVGINTAEATEYGWDTNMQPSEKTLRVTDQVSGTYVNIASGRSSGQLGGQARGVQVTCGIDQLADVAADMGLSHFHNSTRGRDVMTVTFPFIQSGGVGPGLVYPGQMALSDEGFSGKVTSVSYTANRSGAFQTIKIDGNT